MHDADKDKNVRKTFLDMWLEDEKRRQYKIIDFIPNVEDCPNKIYNFFKGLKRKNSDPKVQ